MISKVLFGHDPETFFQSIEKMFRDHARKELSGSCPKSFLK